MSGFYISSTMLQPFFEKKKRSPPVAVSPILGGVALQLDGRFGVVVDLRQAVLQRALVNCWDKWI